MRLTVLANGSKQACKDLLAHGEKKQTPFAMIAKLQRCCQTCQKVLH